MRIDGEKLVRVRAAKAMTQEQLARRSRVSVRTVQRAEVGKSVGTETVAQLAAELNVPQEDLLRGDFDADGDTTPIAVLTVARSPGAVIDLLREAMTCSLDYLVEGDGGKITEAILACVNTLEPHLPSLTPKPNFDQDAGHAETFRLRSKLTVESEVALCLKALTDAGLALYIGRYTARIKVPQLDDCYEWSIRSNQQPEDAMVAVLRIDRAGQDRVLVQCPCGAEVIACMRV
jgi:transcriptional regulator with XRE-family HTH domain